MSGGAVGEAFVIVRPVVADFRQQVATAVNRSIGTATVPLPVTPTIPRGARVSWETLATGAAIPKVVPLPVQPTITPQAKAAFTGEVGGLRGALLGAGQFGASRALGISGLAAGLFAFAVAGEKAVKSAATLEQELNVFQQVSGATAEQMERVREEARKLGADISLPAVSAGDAAATMTELAKAGLSVDQVLSGTKGTLQLAAAAQLDFATASQLSAGALNAFELSGNDAVKVADLLAGAANAAQGDIADFGNALTQSAAVAHQAGLSVQETVTFLTELAKAGIQGSDAGTSLRVALLRLIAPTTEATAIFKELGIEITDAAGNVRVDVFEQLRRSMLGLSPATRNAALATIFGTDAIRSAAIFTREGAKGFAEMERQVSRQGQAAQTAAARTKGLTGSVQALVSNIETFATDVGTIALPAFTVLAEQASMLVSELDKADVKLIHIVDTLGNVKIPGSGGTSVFDAIGNAVKKVGGDALDAVPNVKALREEITLLQKISSLFADKPILAPPKVSAAGTDAFGLKAFLTTGLDDPQLAKAMAAAGEKAGKGFGKGVGDGITKEERGVINAAKRTVSDAQRALRDVVAEGAQAVEDAAVSAKQNLVSIGQTLSQQVTDILDSGPLAQRIKALQESLQKSQDALQRQQLGRSLRDAKEQLAQAEAQLQGGAPKTTIQKQAEQEFLRPFQERVKDAKAALDEFNTQGTIDKLTERLNRQKERLQKILDDLIAKFNAGLLSGTAVNAQVAALLQKNVGPMSKAGQAQGFAFKQAFAAQVAALQAQIAAILGGPQTKKTGVGPSVVRPADVASQAAQRTADAQRSVKDAIVNLNKATANAIAGPDGTNDILKDIRRQLGGGSASKPSGAARSGRAPRGTRSGGR